MNYESDYEWDEPPDEVEWEDEEDDEFSDGPLRGENVTVDGYRGVAWYVDKDDGERFVTAHMVGDDTSFVHDRDDVTTIRREEFCGGCGQVGCEHDGWER